MWILTAIICAALALIGKWYMDRRSKQRYFDSIGIPGPKPDFLMGNWEKLMKDGASNTLLDWHKKFGTTFGYYEGVRPIIATSDLKIARQVLIKQFSNFVDRKELIFSSNDGSIVSAEGEHWKRQRMILSPAFSTRGIKEMSSMVNGTINKLMDHLHKKEKEGKPFDVTDYYQGLTMSSIACCGFGLDVDALNHPRDPFLEHCREVFKWRPQSKVYFMLTFVAKYLASCLRALFPGRYTVPANWFHNTAAAIIKARRETQGNRKDFIHLMLMANKQDHVEPKDLESLEVRAEEDAKLDSVDLKATEIEKKITKGKGMSLKEMQASCMTFLLAGFETTSTTLTLLTYQLALHPVVQDKMRQEIEEHFPGDQNIDYLSVQKLPYMDMVFSEVLRLYPPGQVVQNRICQKDCVINNVPIKKDHVVQVLVEAIQMDPELWGPEDPKDFVPERFTPERKSARDSLAWIPFGAGPRNCIGMRFAIMQIKMTMARILKDFSILRCEETNVPLKLERLGARHPAHPIMIKLESRK